MTIPTMPPWATAALAAAAALGAILILITVLRRKTTTTKHLPPVLDPATPQPEPTPPNILEAIDAAFNVEVEPAPARESATRSIRNPRWRSYLKRIITTWLVPVAGMVVCADGILRFLQSRGWHGFDLYASFGIVELITCMIAYYARQSRATNGRIGIHGIAVWILGLASGTFAALGAEGGLTSPVGWFRLFVALAVVYCWEADVYAALGPGVFSTFLDRLRARFTHQHTDADAAETARQHGLITAANHAANIAARNKPDSRRARRLAKRAEQRLADAIERGITIDYDAITRSTAALAFMRTALADPTPTANPWTMNTPPTVNTPPRPNIPVNTSPIVNTHRLNTSPPAPKRTTTTNTAPRVNTPDVTIHLDMLTLAHLPDRAITLAHHIHNHLNGNPGQLPSQRALAEALACSVGSVNKSLTELRTRGVLASAANGKDIPHV